MLQCMGEHKTTLVLTEVHKSARSSHIGVKALAYKILMVVLLLAYPNEGYHCLCQKMWSISETFLPSPCPNITYPVNDFALAFLSMRHGHSMPFSFSTRSTEVPNSRIWLLHQTDKSRNNIQDYDRKSVSFLLAKNHVQIWAPREIISDN